MVIVLGAGLTGLYAAYLLRQKGIEAIVLEASNRVGGRIDTRRFPQEPALTYELGAEWIGRSHTHVRNLCRQLNLPLVSHDLKTSLLLRGEYKKPHHWKLHQQWYTVIHRLMKRFPNLRGKTLDELRHIDWWHYLQEQQINQEDIEILELFHSTDVGESTRHVPAYHMIEEYSQNGGDIAAALRYRVSGGNLRLPEALAATIGAERIFLRCEVTAVRQDRGVVYITAKDGRTAHAHAVICTLPTHAMSQISWSPDFPQSKRHAIQALSYARITKTSVLFKKRFWKDDAFEVITDTLFHHIFHATQGQPGTYGILTSYAVGDRAYVIGRMTDHERLNAMCEALEKPFGSIRHLAVATDCVSWSDNPYSQGAYAIYDTEDLKTQPLLRKPHGHVFMAGEHTAQFQGYMEGALESAEHAVKQVIISSR